MFEDEFRNLLKAHLSYSEDDNDVGDEAALTNLASLLSEQPEVVRQWAQGTARPTPKDERYAITLLKGLKTFS